jgi:hypothetical protein
MSIKKNQVWEVITNTNQLPIPLITIRRIEKNEHGIIVYHASLHNVNIGQGLNEISHLPISESALKKSIRNLVDMKVSKNEEFDEGFKQWRNAKGGVWDIPIVEIISTISETLST